MSDAAGYFEAKGDLDKAVQLYQRGGDVPRALDLCFRAGAKEAADRAANPRAYRNQPAGEGGMFEVLRSIAESLDEGAHPSTVARCAEFFIEHGQVHKAVGLFITGKRFRMAIDLCLDHKVRVGTPKCNTKDEGCPPLSLAASRLVSPSRALLATSRQFLSCVCP
jgi:intraflagellar transport protein 140